MHTRCVPRGAQPDSNVSRNPDEISTESRRRLCSHECARRQFAKPRRCYGKIMTCAFRAGDMCFSPRRTTSRKSLLQEDDSAIAINLPGNHHTFCPTASQLCQATAQMRMELLPALNYALFCLTKRRGIMANRVIQHRSGGQTFTPTPPD